MNSLLDAFLNLFRRPREKSVKFDPGEVNRRTKSNLEQWEKEGWKVPDAPPECPLAGVMQALGEDYAANAIDVRWICPYCGYGETHGLTTMPNMHLCRQNLCKREPFVGCPTLTEMVRFEDLKKTLLEMDNQSCAS